MAYDPKRLKAAREAANLSQNDVSRLLGHDTANISRWESGKCEPKFSTLIRMARLYGVDMNAFVDWGDESGDVMR